MLFQFSPYYMVFRSSDMASDYIAVSIAWSTNILKIYMLSFFTFITAVLEPSPLDFHNGFFSCCCLNHVHFIILFHHFLLGWFFWYFLTHTVPVQLLSFVSLFIFVGIQILTLSPLSSYTRFAVLYLWLKNLALFKYVMKVIHISY